MHKKLFHFPLHHKQHITNLGLCVVKRESILRPVQEWVLLFSSGFKRLNLIHLFNRGFTSLRSKSQICVGFLCASVLHQPTVRVRCVKHNINIFAALKLLFVKEECVVTCAPLQSTDTNTDLSAWIWEHKNNKHLFFSLANRKPCIVCEEMCKTLHQLLLLCVCFTLICCQ